jgi:hypothetical protein
LFHPAAAMKQFSRAMKPFSALVQNSGNAAWLSSRQQERRTAPVAKPGDSQMRTLSFILAFAFVMVGSSIAGSSDRSLPGIGTFAYDGSPIVTVTSQSMIVAAR